MMFKDYSQFINEAQEASTFSIEEFEKFIEKDLSWNMAKVSLLEPDKEILDGKTPSEMYPKHNLFFLYTCMAGSSVKKDIEESCKKFGCKTAKVRVIFNGMRNVDHEYMIALNVIPNILISHKYGI